MIEKERKNAMNENNYLDWMGYHFKGRLILRWRIIGRLYVSVLSYQ